jgi:hypothetical protein
MPPDGYGRCRPVRGSVCWRSSGAFVSATLVAASYAFYQGGMVDGDIARAFLARAATAVRHA